MCTRFPSRKRRLPPRRRSNIRKGNRQGFIKSCRFPEKEVSNLTIGEAIRLCDQLCPNSYEAAEKKMWLSSLDLSIYNEVFQHYQCPQGDFAFRGYQEDTSDTAKLLVPPPYDQLYIQYLVYQMDLYNGETARAANDAAAYNQTYQEFCAYFAQRNRVKPEPRLQF